MRNMWVVMKETCSSTCQIVEFLLYGDFTILVYRFSGGITYLQGSSMVQSGKIAVISSVPAVTDSLKSTNGL